MNATSRTILWNAIGTPTGLGEWFADRVEFHDKQAEFSWGKTEKRTADIIAFRSFLYIRFRWREENVGRSYFELRMTQNELTGDFVLEVTDFAEKGEEDDVKELWESQIADLRRTCGF